MKSVANDVSIEYPSNKKGACLIVKCKLRRMMILDFSLVWNGKPSIFILVRDATSEKLVEENRMLDSIKSMIMKSFPHELKSPINGINGCLEIVRAFIQDGMEEEITS